MVQNKQIIFAEAPIGPPVPGKHVAVKTTEFDLEQAAPSGGLITKNLYASFDPYQRGRMRDPSIKSYNPPYTLGQPIANGGISKVLKSDNPKFKEGDLVTGFLQTEEYSVVAKEAADALRVLENEHNFDPIVFLGPLGMTGLTAYSSLYEIGKPQKGETIFISAASGAVGAIVGHIAKIEGLKVIGSVGSDDKLDYILNELKFDGGFNYKTEKPLDALKRLAPDGVDIYYENVGGEQLEAALEVMNNFGRVIACGMISQYSKSQADRYAVNNLIQIVAKRLIVRGFIVGDKEFGPKYFVERNKVISKWLAEGTLKAKLSIVDGIDNGPEGFTGMLEGKNFGKTVLKIAEA